MAKKVQKILCLLAVVASMTPGSVKASQIWEQHEAPTKFANIVAASLLSGCFGGVVGGVGGYVLQSGTKRKGPAVISATVVGLLSATVAYLAHKNNTPAEWLKQFFAKFYEVSTSRLLAQPDLDVAQWVANQGSLDDLEGVLVELRRICADIPKLQRVAVLLLEQGLDEFGPETVVDLRANGEQLSAMLRLAQRRCVWVATKVDYGNCIKLYEQVKSAQVLSIANRDEWMREHGVQRSFADLKRELTQLSTAFVSLDDILKRLSSVEALEVLTAEQKTILTRCIPSIMRRKERCDVRLGYVVARADYEEFNNIFHTNERASVLQVGGMFRDPDAWFMTLGFKRSLGIVALELNACARDLQRGLDIAQRLHKSSMARHFSYREMEEMRQRSRLMEGLLAICTERKVIVECLRKLENFAAECESVLTEPLAKERVASDLSWMHPQVITEWPLEFICEQLRAIKNDLERVLKRGEDLARGYEYSRLSDGQKMAHDARLAALKSALKIVENRLMFVLHSTEYATEVAKKRSLETYRREQLERERLARAEAREREAAQREQERERQRKAEEAAFAAQRPEPTAPPVVTPQQQGQALETCFCGDEIPADKMYQLGCACKTSFYHEDCIKRWVASSKTCPTCRARASVQDVKKYAQGSDQASAQTVPQAAATSVPQVVSAPALATAPSVPVSQSTTPVAEAVVCYICEDDENLADSTTANCDCTVKKPACRSCLQAWLASRHTCPRCQKAGATLIPFVS